MQQQGGGAAGPEILACLNSSSGRQQQQLKLNSLVVSRRRKSSSRLVWWSWGWRDGGTRRHPCPSCRNCWALALPVSSCACCWLLNLHVHCMQVSSRLPFSEWNWAPVHCNNSLSVCLSVCFVPLEIESRLQSASPWGYSRSSAFSLKIWLNHQHSQFSHRLCLFLPTDEHAMISSFLFV